MARNFARLATTIWRDSDWRALSHHAQWTYMTLLSQSKLSLAGCLDVRLTAWSGLTVSTPQEDVEKYLDELVEHDFIRVDHGTQELAIRTFVEHDDVLKNRNLGKGMWSAWAAIESEELRSYLVDNFPAEAWEERFEPPFPRPKNRSRDRG